MEALSIAFDIIIVGALALPWVLLVIHLFFSDNESSLKSLLDWVKEQDQPALAGVLLFAMAFPLGSAVSRIAQDFFDDDDLHISAFNYLLRVGVTESSILTDVYCHTLPPEEKETPNTQTTSTSKGTDPVAEKRQKFRNNNHDCTYTGRWIVRQVPDPDGKKQIDATWINDQEDLAEYIFHVHEAAVLLQGTDPTERIRQFHDQIIVLRGAAFNGMVALSLCLFWWFSGFKSWLRWAVIAVYLVPGATASVNHFTDHLHSPPYMEFTFLVLAAAGGYLLWQRRPKKEKAPAQPPAQNGRGEIRFIYLLLSLFLTVSAFLGWWATQVLYDQQIIYSYQALTYQLTIETPAKLATPSPK
jgi:hypothetical protein